MKIIQRSVPSSLILPGDVLVEDVNGGVRRVTVDRVHPSDVVWRGGNHPVTEISGTNHNEAKNRFVTVSPENRLWTIERME